MSEDGQSEAPSPGVAVMETATTRLDWPHLALEGLTDAEYHWEPVPDCWGVRPRGTSRAAITAGGGDWTCDVRIPEPVRAPVTTIAWPIAHLVVGVFGARAASHFGGPATSYETHAYAGTADEGLPQLDTTYAAWVGGVRSLAPEDWARPVGPAEGAWARERPTAV